MGRFLTTFSVCFVGIVLLRAAELTNAPSGKHRKDDAAASNLFNGPILRFTIELPASSLDSLRGEPRKPVPASVTIGTQRFDKITLHVKGAAGSTRSIDENPALTLNFDKLVPGRKFSGLDKIHLNNSVQDPSLLSEQMASRLYDEAGIPTARASQAFVTLAGRDLGLYVLKEGYNKSFLRRRFPDPSGNLYDGGFIRDIDQDLERDSGEGPEDRKDLQRLRDAAETADKQLRATRLEAILDIKRFVTLSAMQALLVDWDGYGNNRNNYRLYYQPHAGLFTFIPHGMDQLLGSRGHGMETPSAGLVSRQLFDIPAFNDAFYAEAHRLLATTFTSNLLTAHFDIVEARLLTAFKTLAPDEQKWRINTLQDFRNHALQRIESAKSQLASRPKPIQFNTEGITTLAQWQPRYQRGQAQIEVTRVDGVESLHIAAIARETVSSFRANIRLPMGKYAVTGRLKTKGVVASKDERFQGGAALRISGGEHQQRFSGDHAWTEFSHEFQIHDPREVEIVAELRADAGEVWFDTASLKLIRH